MGVAISFDRLDLPLGRLLGVSSESCLQAVEEMMPTSLPRPPLGLTVVALTLAVLRLRLIGWRAARARAQHDHRGLLRLVDIWTELHRRTLTRLGPDAFSETDRVCVRVCDRVRRVVPRIERETRRLAWAAGRMERARAAADARACQQAQQIDAAARQRLIQFWAEL
ncbi:hypothetical protein [Methylobacterium oryzisoli]|uniref:hypothetical protein n=1 Tax=Methylobacterium oryzisoli TaxID=3385502 RepID=UPI0038915AAC